MKNHPLSLLVVGFPFLAGAGSLTPCADVTFAEQFAFSTNRAAVVAALQPETDGWFVYSILAAQTEGRLADAQALINRWRGHDYSGTCSALQDRQTLLAFDPAKPEVNRLRTLLANHGIAVQPRDRETALAPNTYPSALKAEDVSFAAFSKRGLRPHDLTNDFRFLPFLSGIKSDSDLETCLRDESFLPDVPGFDQALLAYLKSPNHRGAFRADRVFRRLTLDQLERLAKGLKGTDNDLSGNRDFARLVLDRLAPGADEDVLADSVAEKERLLRRVGFADTLAPSLVDLKKAAYSDLLAYGLRHGEEAVLKPAFTTYLGLIRPGADPRDRLVYGSLAGLVTDYLSAYRRAGSDLSEFSELVESSALERFRAETDLLAGRSAEAANAKVLPADAFKALRDRVELNWSKANPALFAADDDVKLALDVKNVGRLRLSVYELDPFEACRTLNGEVKSDINLDGAVPTVSRTIDFSSYPALVRHHETLILGELKEPGLYVVECAGAGVCSRALVRKGRLRLVERHDASGHVFTALDEQGHVVQGAKLHLGESVFTAEENGEIVVPFAQDAKSAGRRTAVVGAGRLAAALSFEHLQETVSLDLVLVLPSEALVAGRRATALLRPRLDISDVAATLDLLKDARLELVFTDADGHEVARPYPDLKLADDAETVVTFTVPERLRNVRFRLTGRVRRATDGQDVALTADASANVNGVCDTRQIGQPFLRRTDAGYVLELRGLNGEPLASREVTLDFCHRAFSRSKQVTLQTDINGCLQLGPLVDIESVRASFAEGGDTPVRPLMEKAPWLLEESVRLPSVLCAAEGEPVELPVRNLLTGDWPGAKRLAVRVSLIELNAAGIPVANRISACSYKDGVLRLEGLPAGDYDLTLRDRGVRCRLAIARTAGTVEGGVIASAARSLTDVGSPRRLRIAAASFATNGVLTVKLANATPEARVHLFAARTFPNADDRLPAEELADALERPAIRFGTWGAKGTDYVSGRDLGEKLRYVLDRRDQPHRIGNLLDRPSLLLNPWSVAETQTADVALRGGDAWSAANTAQASSRAFGAVRSPCFAEQNRFSDMPCRDFLPQAESVIANLRPDANGVITLDAASLPEAGLLAQDFTVVATDGRALDSVALLGAPVPCAMRDRRYKKAPGARSLRGADTVITKTLATHGDLAPFLSLDDFGFLARWPAKSEAEKKALYDEYASHELDFFLHEQDRPFFDAVVKPHLANKRLKRFVDKWLLGENLSSYTNAGELENLNAFELCLLARRDPALAPRIARRFADFCAAHPLDPRTINRAYNRVLGEETVEEQKEAEPVVYRAVGGLVRSRGAMPAMAEAPACEVFDCEADALKPEPAPAAVPAESMRAALRAERAASGGKLKMQMAGARRDRRQLYRPPERTKEWVETHYYHLRQQAPTKDLVPVNVFWRDYAAAIAAGKTDAFVSENILFTGGRTEQVVALATIKGPVSFTRPELPPSGKLQISHHFVDPSVARPNGTPGAAVKDEFVTGRVYEMVTVLANPSDEDLRESVFTELPEGAIALGGERASERLTNEQGAYTIERLTKAFYFPQVIEGAPLPVVAKPTKADTTSWAYVSQNATKGEVLEYLKTQNLESPTIDLGRIAWRMKDGAYAKRVLDVLASRGVYNQELWLAGLLWRDAFDPQRIREVLARRENLRKLGGRLGPALVSPLITIEPEQADLFEHKEYWPLINARAHAVAGGAARLANQQLGQEYRAFLDTLAAKKTLSANDHLLAAVFLIAQDRLEEAKAHVAQVKGEDVETKMQLAYLQAYFAFCDGDAEKGRALAAPYVDHPVPHWQKRFREVLAQADEIAGKTSVTADAEASRAPTLALAFDRNDVVLTSRNLSTCTLKAYPTDLEILFTKDPFGQAKRKGETVRCLKPAWTSEVKLTDGETRVQLPASVKARNLVLVATGADGRAEARLDVTPRVLDVQVAREYRQLRVRGEDGKPLPGTYVKVFVRSADGGEVKFHKDGYTDLRGAFDYASVSTDTDFKPAEYAILVLHDKSGVKALTVAE